MMVHLVVLIVLGLIVTEPVVKSGAQSLVASAVEEIPSFDQIDAEVVERDVPEGLSINESQVFAEATEVAEPTATGESVEIERAELKPAMVASTVGRNGAAFFGAVAKGKKYVFVVDNSNSMNSSKGKFSKFVRAKAELLETISKMTKEKSYYIIFFNAGPTRMFDPEPAKTFIPATKENYQKVYDWLAQVELARGTRGTAAMQMALDLKPDAIYVLGDGAFTDDVADVLRSMNSKHIPIHTLLFDSSKGSSKGRDSMEQIAKENGGSYTSVD